jgi:hypothetical protein
MFRRLINWLRRYRIRKKFVLLQGALPFDIDEFASLLQSGRPEDVKLIARTLSHSDRIEI